MHLGACQGLLADKDGCNPFICLYEKGDGSRMERRISILGVSSDRCNSISNSVMSTNKKTVQEHGLKSTQLNPIKTQQWAQEAHNMTNVNSTFKSNVVANLFKAIFGTRQEARVEEIPGYDYRLQQIVVGKTGVCKVVDVTVAGADGKTEAIKIEKRCMGSYIGLPKPEYFIFDKKNKKDSIAAKAMWDSNNWAVFGNGLKGDDAHNSKFYAYECGVARRILGNSAGDWSAYGSKLFTDLKFVKEAEALVVTYTDYVERLRKIGFYGEIQEPGNDGSAVARHDFVPKTKGFVHDQIVAVPNQNWKEMYDNGEVLNISLCKGALDTLLVTNDQFDAAFGFDTEVVLIKKDMIKVNYDVAVSGSWLIGFTWNTEKPFTMALQWEGTQFLGTDPEVKQYLLDQQAQAIEKANDLFSTKEKVIEYLGFQIDDKEDAIVETKLLAAILSDLPYEFAWIQKQIQDMRIREVFNAIACYGIQAKGQVLCTDNVHSNTSVRYMSKEDALSIGGDNDHDLFGYFVNNALGKIVLMRYPMVGGFTVRDIPANVHVDDHFPGFVELVIKHAMRVPFNRNMIKDNPLTKRIMKDVEYTRHIARKIVGESGIGFNTILLTL